MSRVTIVDPKTATGDARALLDAAQQQLGVTPTLIRVLANSPKALEGLMGLYGALVALNVFTNILGKATQVDIDFPKVALLGAPASA